MGDASGAEAYVSLSRTPPKLDASDVLRYGEYMETIDVRERKWVQTETGLELEEVVVREHGDGSMETIGEVRVLQRIEVHGDQLFIIDEDGDENAQAPIEQVLRALSPHITWGQFVEMQFEESRAKIWQRKFLRDGK